MKYTKFEALIKCYGALMNRNEYDEKKLKDDFFVKDLLTMTTLPAVHPALLNGLVMFALHLLNNNSIKNNVKQSNEFVRFVSENLSNGV